MEGSLQGLNRWRQVFVPQGVVFHPVVLCSHNPLVEVVLAGIGLWERSLMGAVGAEEKANSSASRDAPLPHLFFLSSLDADFCSSDPPRSCKH